MKPNITLITSLVTNQLVDLKTLYTNALLTETTFRESTHHQPKDIKDTYGHPTNVLPGLLVTLVSAITAAAAVAVSTVTTVARLRLEVQVVEDDGDGSGDGGGDEGPSEDGRVHGQEAGCEVGEEESALRAVVLDQVGLEGHRRAEGHQSDD